MTINRMDITIRFGYLLSLAISCNTVSADIMPNEVPPLKTPFVYFSPNIEQPHPSWTNCYTSESDVVNAYISFELSVPGRCEVWDNGPLTSWSKENSPWRNGNFHCLSTLGFDLNSLQSSRRYAGGYTESQMRALGRTVEKTSGGCKDLSGVSLYRRSAFYYCPEHSTIRGIGDGNGGYSEVYCQTDHYLSPEPEDCQNEGNPCNPATGNKTQVETDIPGNGQFPGFTRYYSSQGSSDGASALGNGWRHNYQRQVDAAAGKYEELARIKSRAYLSPSLACRDGWVDIRETVFRGLYANRNAYLRNGVCHVAHENIRLRLHTTQRVSPTEGTHTVSRVNGRTLTFIQDSGDWVEMNGALGSLTSAQGGGWIFKDKDGSTETYDNAGRLQQTSLATGQLTAFTYDTEGRLGTVTGNFGYTLSFHYDEAGHLNSITTPDGDLSYGYDTEGRLTSVEYPDNSEKHYHYEDTRSPYHLTGITDENNQRYATWAYDAEGRAILSEHANSAERVEFTYNADGTTTVTDAVGAERIYHFTVQQGQMKVDHIEGDRCTTCSGGGIQDYTYDSNGFIASKTDWNGNTTIYTRDDQGRELSRTEASGTPQARTITTTWDVNLNKRLTVTEPEQITEYTYDTEGRLQSQSQSAVQ